MNRVINKRIGTYIIKKTTTEAYKAYVPIKLPPVPPIDVESLYPHIERAMTSLAELSSVTEIIPNTSLFLYMYVRKEALLSSQIEGTQSSFSDLILFENNQKPNICLEDVEEVSNYVQAMSYGLTQLRNGFPLSLRLIREIHAILLSGSRGSFKLPGEFRKSQNWIGGSSPGNAIFVPPPPEELMNSLSNFEAFLHDKNNKLPKLIKIGIMHMQFETIHPFLDGNGRLGRLLITLLLCENNILNEPILYLSLYLKQNRDRYYDLLNQVRFDGNWEIWLEFFLEGIHVSAKQAMQTAQQINILFMEDLEKINNLGKIRFSCIQTLEHLKKLPQTSVLLLSKSLDITAPTARSALNHMVDAGILEEVTGRKKDKIYVYRKYLDILEIGAKPFKIEKFF